MRELWENFSGEFREILYNKSLKEHSIELDAAQ
jgi:hypothetical protein